MFRKKLKLFRWTWALRGPVNSRRSGKLKSSSQLNPAVQLKLKLFRTKHVCMDDIKNFSKYFLMNMIVCVCMRGRDEMREIGRRRERQRKKERLRKSVPIFRLKVKIICIYKYLIIFQLKLVHLVSNPRTLIVKQLQPNSHKKLSKRQDTSHGS